MVDAGRDQRHIHSFRRNAGIEIAHIKHPRRGREQGGVIANDLSLAEAIINIRRAGAGFIMADVEIKNIGGIGRHPRRRKLIAHDFPIFATAGTQDARATRRIHRHGGKQLHGPGVKNYCVRPVAAGGHAAAFRRLIRAVGIHTSDAVKGIQPIHNRRHCDRITGRFLQGKDIQRLSVTVQ